MQLRFVGIGPQRTGTTWLYELLRSHPQICFPKGVKETFFFDEHFDKGWSWYRDHFHHRSDGQYLGEIAPTYFDMPESAKRLQQHNRNCRIIITLRDPAARSFSLYLHHRKKGRLNCLFRESFKKMPRILTSSNYGKHIPVWIDRFGLDQILILLLEDISLSTDHVIKTTFNFIGVEMSATQVSDRQRRVNKASLPAYPSLARLFTRASDRLRDKRLYFLIEVAKKMGLKKVYSGFKGALPELEPEIRQDLINYFEEDIDYIENLLGRHLPRWRQN